MPTSADVIAAGERFQTAGLPHRLAESDRCCHAVQDKVMVDAPDVPLGMWEFYTVLADDPAGTAPNPCAVPPPQTRKACAAARDLERGRPMSRARCAGRGRPRRLRDDRGARRG